MANKLIGLKITSTDLVTQGANPGAKISLFKSRGLAKNGATQKANGIQVAKEAQTFGDEMYNEMLRDVTSQSWDYCYAFADSLCSIIFDEELGEDGKLGMLYTSLDEFAEALRGAMPEWAAGRKAASDGTEIAKSAAGARTAEQEAAFNVMLQKYEIATLKYAKSDQGDKEVTDTMKIDKSKMTPGEQAVLAGFEKKYGMAEPGDGGVGAAPAGAVVTLVSGVNGAGAAVAVPAGAVPALGTPGGGIAKTTGGMQAGVDAVGGAAGAKSSGATDADAAFGTAAGAAPALHPEVKKILDENRQLGCEVAELKKSLEINDLATLAAKYEVVGKKAGELAPKLYELKKAGGTAYDDYIGLLDEQVALMGKIGLFSEIGSNRSGNAASMDGELGAKAADIMKSANGMSEPEAIAKAFEENPELAARYETEYMAK